MMRRGWTFGLKGQFEMMDDPIDDLRLFDKIQCVPGDAAGKSLPWQGG